MTKLDKQSSSHFWVHSVTTQMKRNLMMITLFFRKYITKLFGNTIKMQSLPFEGARVQRERITKQDINEFGATIGCPGCNAIRDNKRAQAHSYRCRMRIEERLRTTPHGAERLDRRNEVINGALAEEVRREEQKRRRSDRSAAEVTEAESEEKIDLEINVDDSQWEQTGGRKESNLR